MTYHLLNGYGHMTVVKFERLPRCSASRRFVVTADPCTLVWTLISEHHRQIHQRNQPFDPDYQFLPRDAMLVRYMP